MVNGGLNQFMGNGPGDIREGTGERRRRHRSKRERRSRRNQKLIDNLVWLAGALAIGLPLLAVLLYALSRY
jgi:ABC-type Fe3+ transport system permease subunit